ncbi:MAG TPA: hypothetical protein VNS53_06270 [Sphingomicrobium sp.]|jgi:hypothetical protein|nr:hypothetical protein [Sphingomicrobium sp.]
MGKDYHGYKSYGEADASADGFIGAIRRRLKAALNFIARPTPTPTILSEGRVRGYSTLGTKSGLGRSDDCPFPAAPASNENA